MSLPDYILSKNCLWKYLFGLVCRIWHLAIYFHLLGVIPFRVHCYKRRHSQAYEHKKNPCKVFCQPKIQPLTEMIRKRYLSVFVSLQIAWLIQRKIY